MNKIKSTKGITLISLVITIIIMLILVGVSITIALKGDLFDTTKRAAKETENAKNIEQELANGRIKIGDTWYDSIEDYINDNPSGNQGEGGGETPPEEPETPPEEPETPPVVDTSIYENAPKDETTGVLTANATYTSNEKTAVVPKGFKVVPGIGGTTSIDDGLVIQDKDGNEFVWIPVAVTASDKETEIKSFNRSKWADNARVDGLDTNYTEPYTNGYEGEVAEYNAMLKSVYENKGFYIGRYEAGSTTKREANTSNGTTEMVVKQGVDPYNFVGWGASMTDYTSNVLVWGFLDQGKGAVLLSKEMYQNRNDVGVTSTLCYGVQWDAMLDFIKDQKNVTNSADWGNYKPTEGTGTLAKTASLPTYAAKNIYDVAGNVEEWTMEAISSTNRVFRGGDYYGSGSSLPASSRGYGTPDDCGVDFGFRVALYIK